MSEVAKISNQRIDELEKVTVGIFNEVDCPLKHTFLDGVYVREIFMPAGTLILSKIHKTRHPFSVIEGIVSVWVNGGEEHIIVAPYEGITEPNTQRLLYIHEDCVWLTYHLNPDNEDVGEIEERIIEKHENNHLINTPLHGE